MYIIHQIVSLLCLKSMVLFTDSTSAASMFLAHIHQEVPDTRVYLSSTFV